MIFGLGIGLGIYNSGIVIIPRTVTSSGIVVTSGGIAVTGG